MGVKLRRYMREFDNENWKRKVFGSYGFETF